LFCSPPPLSHVNTWETQWFVHEVIEEVQADHHHLVTFAMDYLPLLSHSSFFHLGSKQENKKS
jgi:hypothetical protein